MSPVMSTGAPHALSRLAEHAPHAPRTRRGGHIIPETRALNMARNLPDSSGFDCGDRQPFTLDCAPSVPRFSRILGTLASSCGTILRLARFDFEQNWVRRRDQIRYGSPGGWKGASELSAIEPLGCEQWAFCWDLYILHVCLVRLKMKIAPGALGTEWR